MKREHKLGLFMQQHEPQWQEWKGPKVLFLLHSPISWGRRESHDIHQCKMTLVFSPSLLDCGGPIQAPRLTGQRPVLWGASWEKLEHACSNMGREYMAPPFHSSTEAEIWAFLSAWAEGRTMVSANPSFCLHISQTARLWWAHPKSTADRAEISPLGGFLRKGRAGCTNHPYLSLEKNQEHGVFFLII